jgi:hypothetical protein
MLKSLICIVIVSLTLTGTAIAGTVETGQTTNPCSLSYMDFENGYNVDVIASMIPGLSFTTTFQRRDTARTKTLSRC